MTVDQRRLKIRSWLCWPGLRWIVALGFALRLLGMAISEQAQHSDEIFQAVEQAHRLVYGYGYVPWEYVHGIRSWLLPGLIAGVLSLCRLAGLNDPSLYIPVVQLWACVLSLSAIVCAYWLGRTLMSETVGRIASVLAAGWYEMVAMATKATPEILGAYLVLGALTCLVASPSRKLGLICGFLGGLCAGGAIALRLQYAPVVVVIVAVAGLYTWQRRWSRAQAGLAVAGFLAMVLFAGWLDDYTWGSYFASYYNNYLYNQVYKVSSLWGEQSIWYYPALLGAYSAGLFWLAIVAACRRKGPKPWLILSLLAAILLSHSLIAHKEYRFIFAAVPFCLLMTAQMIDDLWQPAWRLGRQGRNWGQVLARLTVFYTVLGLLVSLVILGRNARLQAYLYLYDQSALVSVLNLNTAWYNSGGYYYLHRDVPIYFPEHVESIDPDDYARYASHIVCRRDHEAIKGFAPLAQFGKLEVRAAQSPPTETLDVDTRYPPQGGVDGIYQPRVSPRF
jgi:GPI mannosyltransferase 3